MPGLQARGGVIEASRATDLTGRIASLPWEAIRSGLGERGFATTGRLLDERQCQELIALFAEEGRFRSRVDMARHGFGEGEYKYFAEPLPPMVTALRRHVYPRLVPLANRWMEISGARERYPDDLEDLRALCARHGQTRPTPLLLRYREGGYNCLHQDLYGAVAFPFQLTFLLSAPDVDYTGGEFLLVEQRPRRQSRAEVVPLARGEAVIFCTRARPVAGVRGHYQAIMRHGVSRVRAGERYTLGVIFHDAE